MKDLSRALGFALTFGHWASCSPTLGPILLLEFAVRLCELLHQICVLRGHSPKHQSHTTAGRSDSMCRSLRCHRRKQIVCPLLIEMHYSSDLFLWIVLFLQFLGSVASVLRVLPRHVAHLHRLLLLEVLAFRPMGLELPPGRCRFVQILILVI